MSVCVRVQTSAVEKERVVAELYALGTQGIEELEADAGALLLAYFPEGQIPNFEDLHNPSRGVEVSRPELVPPCDWEERWREGLAPRQIEGLWIRPSWCASEGEPELVIDPEQAFGTGEHASTRLSLTLLLKALQPGDRLLDLGTGSGILGLAALRCGAAFALALEVRDGSIESIKGEERFQLSVANMLLEPLSRVVPEALSLTEVMIVSGYLEDQSDQVARLFPPSWTHKTTITETQSGDRWCASCWYQS